MHCCKLSSTFECFCLLSIGLPADCVSMTTYVGFRQNQGLELPPLLLLHQILSGLPPNELPSPSVPLVFFCCWQSILDFYSLHAHTRHRGDSFRQLCAPCKMNSVTGGGGHGEERKCEGRAKVKHWVGLGRHWPKTSTSVTAQTEEVPVTDNKFRSYSQLHCMRYSKNSHQRSWCTRLCVCVRACTLVSYWLCHMIEIN